jgi:hypothetical protein
VGDGSLVSLDRKINLPFFPICGLNIGAEASTPHLVWTFAATTVDARAATTSAACPRLASTPPATSTAADKRKGPARPDPRPPPSLSGVQPLTGVGIRTGTPAPGAVHPGWQEVPSLQPVAPTPSPGLMVPAMLQACASVKGGPAAASGNGGTPPLNPRLDAVS